MNTKPFLFLVIATACASNPTPVVPKAGRQVGVHITQAESNSYDVEFSRVQGLGIDVIPLTFVWNTIETSTGFDFSNLNIANAYYPAKGMKISLNLTPIAAVSRGLPSDLQLDAFDDRAVIARFRVFMDSVHKKLADVTVNNVIVGLEVDDYLGSHPSEWSTYKVFYDSAVATIKHLWGSAMPVGVETTWAYASGLAKDQILALNEHSDMMVLSYYPEQDDFSVKQPGQVNADIVAIINLYSSIPVFIVECGYQTSSTCGSSDELQRQFIAEMFNLWDAHADKISFMGFLWLTDLSDATVDQYVTEYNATTLPYLDKFKGYLQTTGLRRYAGTGTDKPGFTQLQQELKWRGW